LKAIANPENEAAAVANFLTDSITGESAPATGAQVVAIGKAAGMISAS